jgi:hypothetical protein
MTVGRHAHRRATDRHDTDRAAADLETGAAMVIAGAFTSLLAA